MQTHQPSTEKGRENLQVVPKSPPIGTNQAYPIITGCQQLMKDFAAFFSVVATMLLNNMTESEKKEVEFPCLPTLWQGYFNIM